MGLSVCRAQRIETAARALIEGWWGYEIKTYTAEGQRLLNALRAELLTPPEPPVGAGRQHTPRGQSDR